MSAKIEPLDIDGIYAGECDHSHPDGRGFVLTLGGTTHGHILTRDQFAALVRWGAAALAVTHPDRAPKAEPDAEC